MGDTNTLSATEQEARLARGILEKPASEAVHDLAAIASPVVLHLVASEYNWDDGFEIPFAIIRCPRCDFGTALMLFWLADPTAPRHSHQTEFLDEARRLLSSGSLSASIPFDPTTFFGWNRLYRRKLERDGFPSILLGNSSATPSGSTEGEA